MPEEIEDQPDAWPDGKVFPLTRQGGTEGDESHCRFASPHCLHPSSRT